MYDTNIIWRRDGYRGMEPTDKYLKKKIEEAFEAKEEFEASKISEAESVFEAEMLRRGLLLEFHKNDYKYSSSQKFIEENLTSIYNYEKSNSNIELPLADIRRIERHISKMQEVIRNKQLQYTSNINTFLPENNNIENIFEECYHKPKFVMAKFKGNHACKELEQIGMGIKINIENAEKYLNSSIAKETLKKNNPLPEVNYKDEKLKLTEYNSILQYLVHGIQATGKHLELMNNKINTYKTTFNINSEPESVFSDNTLKESLTEKISYMKQQMPLYAECDRIKRSKADVKTGEEKIIKLEKQYTQISDALKANEMLIDYKDEIYYKELEDSAKVVQVLNSFKKDWTNNKYNCWTSILMAAVSVKLITSKEATWYAMRTSKNKDYTLNLMKGASQINVCGKQATAEQIEQFNIEIMKIPRGNIIAFGNDNDKEEHVMLSLGKGNIIHFNGNIGNIADKRGETTIAKQLKKYYQGARYIYHVKPPWI